MSTNRKCKVCGHWTTDSDYCQNCGALINMDLIEERNSEIKRIEEEKNYTPDSVDIFFTILKTSSNPLYRFLYYVLYSMWLVFAGIVSFIVWLVSIIAG